MDEPPAHCKAIQRTLSWLASYDSLWAFSPSAEDQIVSTDPTNILIRSLKMRQNADSQNKGRAQQKSKAAAGIKR